MIIQGYDQIIFVQWDISKEVPVAEHLSSHNPRASHRAMAIAGAAASKGAWEYDNTVIVAEAGNSTHMASLYSATFPSKHSAVRP